MLVGYLKKRTLEIKEGGEKKYIAGSLLFPLAPRLDITLSKNNSDNQDAPAFYIMANKPKGWNGGKQRIGALWLDTVANPASSRDGETYMRGHIETPLVPQERIYVAVFAAKASFEGETVERDYDVLWSPMPKKKEDDQDQPAQHSNGLPTVDIDDDEIPF